MNCDRAERLLPLLGRGDLKPKDARALQEHLLDCSRCGESVHDYAQFFDLLHSTAELDFDEEFFGRIRRSVLSEIRLRERRPPSSPQWWQSNPVAALGIVVLVMIAVGAGIALFKRTWSGLHNERVASSTEEVHAVHQPPQVIPATTINAVKPEVKERRGAVVNSKRNAWDRLSRRSRNLKTAQAGDMIARQDGQVRFDRKPPEETPNVELSLQQAATVQRQKASRIEILTADPNIRIIWLVAKNTK